MSKFTWILFAHENLCEFHFVVIFVPFDNSKIPFRNLCWNLDIPVSFLMMVLKKKMSSKVWYHNITLGSDPPPPLYTFIMLLHITWSMRGHIDQLKLKPVRCQHVRTSAVNWQVLTILHFQEQLKYQTHNAGVINITSNCEFSS